MASRPALLRLVGDAADQVARDHLSVLGFKPVAPLGERTIRRYLYAREFRDVEVDVFRDAGWGAEGGFVRIGLRSLVHPVQQVFGGVAQSLLSPTTGAPFMPFELGPHPVDSPGAWLVRAPADVGLFASGLSGYLREVALPWLAQTESKDAVLAHLERLGNLEQREQLLRAWPGG